MLALAFSPSAPLHHAAPISRCRCATLRRPRAQLGGGKRRSPPPTVTDDIAEAERKYGPRTREALAPGRSVAEALYGRLRGRLIADTALLGVAWSSAVWSLSTVVDAKSAVLGCVAGMGYILLLSPDVGELAKSGGSVLDAGKSNQPLRYLLLPLLVLFIAKSHGALHVLPAIAGFFCYKVALLVPLLTGEAFVDE